MCAKSLQSCLTLCDPMDCSPPGSSVYRDSPGKNTGVGCHFLLQAIFPTQGLNSGILHCRQILSCLSHTGIIISLLQMENLRQVEPQGLPRAISLMRAYGNKLPNNVPTWFFQQHYYVNSLLLTW